MRGFSTWGFLVVRGGDGREVAGFTSASKDWPPHYPFL
jgi:hypothetical protein